MVSIVTKRIKGNEYLYLVNSVRKGIKITQKTIKYIGKKRPILREEFECMRLSYQNKDWILNEFQEHLSYQDHHFLKEISNKAKKHYNFLDSVSREKARERFLSMFISNSNAIEGSRLTVKETFNLLFNDITPKGSTKKEVYMAFNLLNAWEYLEKNYKHFPSHADLWKLHSLVNKNIEDDTSLESYKKVQNYIGDIYTSSWLFVDEKMETLLQWIKNAYKKIDDFEVAFQSHAQFEIIHPFVDGNGRVGRLLLNWLLMHKGLMEFAIHVSKRSEYITALENSKKGKIEAICSFCCKSYKLQYNFV